MRILIVDDNQTNREVLSRRLWRQEYEIHSEADGIGLAWCQMVVEAHRATIWTQSEIGQGSTLSTGSDQMARDEPVRPAPFNHYLPVLLPV